MNTENNKIIAEFMGFIEQKDPTERFFGQWFIDKPTETAWSNREKILFFDCDWNWLMEVVAKIEQQKYFKKEIQFSITKHSVCIQSIANENVIISPCIFSKWNTYAGTEKTQAVYNACLEFIKLYNQQKQN